MKALIQEEDRRRLEEHANELDAQAAALGKEPS
jgi:hypothetical protein